MKRFAALVISLSLAPACDGGAKDQSAPKSADENAKAPAKADVKTPPHGAPGDAAANPHAMPPGGPHGAMPGGAPPMMGQMHKGPPREVTPSGETVESSVRGLKVATPKEWESNTPKSQMRAAEWILPGPGGDGELVVYRFPGGGGGVQANVDRWKGQFQPPEGKTVDDVSTVKEIAGSGGLSTTLVDVRGTFVAAVQPGADAKHNEADYRMLAAIVQGSGDPFYFKLVGPTPTIDLWAAAYDDMIASFSVDGSEGAAPTAPAGEGKAEAPAADAKAPAADAKAETKAADAKAETKAADAKAEAK
jgi:hypothetical protein